MRDLIINLVEDFFKSKQNFIHFQRDTLEVQCNPRKLQISIKPKKCQNKTSSGNQDKLSEFVQ